MARLDRMTFGSDFAKQQDDEEEGSHEPDFEELRGCFCQGKSDCTGDRAFAHYTGRSARMHPLSHYTPMCPSCGLVLCGLQLPHLPCPSCQRPLLNPVSRERVKRKLQDEINDVLAKEQAERDKVEEERRQLLIAQSGGGIFPTLGGTQVKPSKADTATRRVLTIGNKPAATKGKGKTGTTTPTAATLTTYRPKIPLSQAAQDALVDREERKKLGRVERPFTLDLEPSDERAKRERAAKLNEAWRERQGRPWGDMDFESQDMGMQYVPVGQTVKDEAPRPDASSERTRPVIPGAEVKVPKANKPKKKKTGDTQTQGMKEVNSSKEEGTAVMNLKALEIKD